MTGTDATMVRQLLLNNVRMLMMIDIPDLEAHVSEHQSSLDRAEGIGCFIDPSGWLAAKKNGSFENVRVQLEIAKHFLAIRKLVEKLEERRDD